MYKRKSRSGFVCQTGWFKEGEPIKDNSISPDYQLRYIPLLNINTIRLYTLHPGIYMHQAPTIIDQLAGLAERSSSRSPCHVDKNFVRKNFAWPGPGDYDWQQDPERYIPTIDHHRQCTNMFKDLQRHQPYEQKANKRCSMILDLYVRGPRDIRQHDAELRRSEVCRRKKYPITGVLGVHNGHAWPGPDPRSVQDNRSCTSLAWPAVFI